MLESWKPKRGPQPQLALSEVLRPNVEISAVEDCSLTAGSLDKQSGVRP